MCTFPADEFDAERLDALYRYDILDTASEPMFEELVALAALVYQVPIALLSFVDEQRQWFKARIGKMPAQLPREMALCAFVIQSGQEVVVTDTLTDDRFVNHPLVTAEPNIRFYAAVPMISPDGHAIGALCVMDYQPRTTYSWQIDALRLLGKQTMRQIEIRTHLLSMSESMLNCSNALLS